MGLGGAPHETGFVHGRIEVRERRRGEVVEVVGEEALGVGVADHGRHAGDGQHGCGVGRRAADQRQRVGALRVDVRREQRSQRGDAPRARARARRPRLPLGDRPPAPHPASPATAGPRRARPTRAARRRRHPPAPTAYRASAAASSGSSIGSASAIPAMLAADADPRAVRLRGGRVPLLVRRSGPTPAGRPWRSTRCCAPAMPTPNRDPCSCRSPTTSPWRGAWRRRGRASRSSQQRAASSSTSTSPTSRSRPGRGSSRPR